MIYTSYYAVAGKIPDNVVKVSISKGIPTWFVGHSYDKLAPNWDTVRKYKDGGSWKEYTFEYSNTILNKLSPTMVIKELMLLSGNYDVVLLCYEKSTDNCHRHLVRDWLKSAGIRCEEYRFN